MRTDAGCPNRQAWNKLAIEISRHRGHAGWLEYPPGNKSVFPKVSARRPAAKAMSWRIIGTFDTLVLSWLVITYICPPFGREDNYSDALHG
jgi:hypothetical protein